MRSVLFAVFDAKLTDVERSLADGGLSHNVGAQWLYPAEGTPILYVDVRAYDASTDDWDWQELGKARVDQTPTVVVQADITGRVEGDAEVRHITEVVMSRFDALAFDDYAAYEHAWTLEEIRNGTTFDGLRYFDYRGHFERTRGQS